MKQLARVWRVGGLAACLLGLMLVLWVLVERFITHTAILGWPERDTTLVMGGVVVTYTVLGGIKAVTWSDVQQMCVIFFGLAVSLVTVVVLLPHSVSFSPLAANRTMRLFPVSATKMVPLASTVTPRGP